MEHQVSNVAASRNLRAWKRYNKAKNAAVHNHRLDNTIGCQLLMKQGIPAVNAKMFVESIDNAKLVICGK